MPFKFVKLRIGGTEYDISQSDDVLAVLNLAGTVIGRITNAAAATFASMAVTGVSTLTGLVTATAGLRIGTGATVAGVFGLGTPEQVTIATDVLTVTRPHVNVLPESGTSDAVTSIVYAAAAEGDLLYCMSTATNTITFTRTAGLLLGAATRAVAPGGSIMLQKVGTNWVEREFLAAAS